MESHVYSIFVRLFFQCKLFLSFSKIQDERVKMQVNMKSTIQKNQTLFVIIVVAFVVV